MNNGTDYYTSNLWRCRILLIINLILTYGLAPYCLCEIYVNAKGRTFLEVIGEISKDILKPKYKYGANWREHFYLIQGSWWPSVALIFPYMFGPPITGLEYSFMRQETEPESFIETTFEPLITHFKKLNNNQ